MKSNRRSGKPLDTLPEPPQSWKILPKSLNGICRYYTKSNILRGQSIWRSYWVQKKTQCTRYSYNFHCQQTCSLACAKPTGVWKTVLNQRKMQCNQNLTLSKQGPFEVYDMAEWVINVDIKTVQIHSRKFNRSWVVQEHTVYYTVYWQNWTHIWID